MGYWQASNCGHGASFRLPGKLLVSRHNRPGYSLAKPLRCARLHDLRRLHATTLLLAGVLVEDSG
jgi:hypothetical protein